MSRAEVTCHILDTVTGRPAAGVQCSISKLDGFNSKEIAKGATDKDGRIINWDSSLAEIATSGKLNSGVYKIRFETGAYLSRQNDGRAFFPFVEVVFQALNPPENHYHIPLLLSNYSYSTYRGS